MTPYSSAVAGSCPFSEKDLQIHWQRLNTRYFGGVLPPIGILWSRRLTSAVGMFSSHGGIRTMPQATPPRHYREIRLSLPLFERLTVRTPYAEQELLNTLAHEMIHQWQFDILKRRPDHGPAFSQKMREINRTGEVVITTYHSLEEDVIALSRFAWRCRGCGHIYHRQRKTIYPKRHHCGVCQGSLQELSSPTQLIDDRPPSYFTHVSRRMNRSASAHLPSGTAEQLPLVFT